MQQTIQFDPQHDPVSTVLLQVARAYGFTGITEAMASDGKPQGIYPTRPPMPTTPKILWEVPRGTPKEGPVALPSKDFEPDSDMPIVVEEKSPWTPKRIREFLLNLTIPAQRALALLAVKGEVTFDEMCTYLDVDSLQGVFSTVGSAVRNTRGLPDEVRPYARHRSPRKLYKMDVPLQQAFFDAYESSARVQTYLQQALQYKASLAETRHA